MKDWGYYSMTFSLLTHNFPKTTKFTGKLLSGVLEDMYKFAKSVESTAGNIIFRVALRIEPDDTFVGSISYAEEKKNE